MAARSVANLILLGRIVLLLAIDVSHAAFHHASGGISIKRSHCAKSSRRRSTNVIPSLFMESAHSCPNETTKTIYNLPDSGWKSNKWNWGSACGTGHDCAVICRRRWSDASDRRGLVNALLSPVEFKASHPNSEVPFEEVKLILGLAWQHGRWDGNDGGPGGYAAVLDTMAGARKYENDDEVISALNFIEDVSERFSLICKNAEKLKRMKAIANDIKGKHAMMEEVFMDRRICAGLILDAMSFVENGL